MSQRYYDVRAFSAELERQFSGHRERVLKANFRSRCRHRSGFGKQQPEYRYPDATEFADDIPACSPERLACFLVRYIRNRRGEPRLLHSLTQHIWPEIKFVDSKSGDVDTCGI